jgi:cytochrome bd-type quinol oxidase subunit 1
MPFGPVFDAFGILIVFIGIFSPVILALLIYYFKKRLEHKQIMAAIEKGTPLSELRTIKKASPPGPVWIKNLTGGIALLIIAAGIICLGVVYLSNVEDVYFDETLIWALVVTVTFALGISRLLRGILQRKAEQKNLLNGNNGVIDKSDTASEIPPSPENNLK